MRPLEESEVAQVFEKLFKFIGKNLRNVLESSSSSGGGERKGKGKGNDSDDEDEEEQRGVGFCFRLHKQRVYYVKDEIVKRATNISREQLVTLGQNMEVHALREV